VPGRCRARVVRAPAVWQPCGLIAYQRWSMVLLWLTLSTRDIDLRGSLPTFRGAEAIGFLQLPRRSTHRPPGGRTVGQRRRGRESYLSAE
jgi:hypothetical protein